MQQQASLFDHVAAPAATPYAPSSDTSRDAAHAAQAFAQRQAQQVYAYILGCGARGATQKEIAEALFLGRASVAARCNALEHTAPDEWRIQKTGARRLSCAVYTTRHLR